MSYQTAYGASIYLTFAGKPLVLTGTLSDNETNFEVDMPTFTLGELINGIIHMVKPSYTLNFDAPWSYILNAEIKNFKLKLKVPSKSSGKPIEFGIQYDTSIQLPGFEISSLRVMARSIRDVNFNMTGSLDFLGLKYNLDDLFGKDGVNLLDPQGMPQPAPKPSLFKLNFLGAGQHLELTDAAKYNHVNEVVDRLQELMKEPPPGTIVPPFTQALHFNNNSQWLFAIDAVIMNTVAFKIVFNDPVLYGLYLSLSGEKAKVFAGLEFEILYKKITDDIGVFQIELKLPDSIRNLEFGAVSITLPVIGIWIYTNGNFKIDLGFPYNNDFSRSFTVQAFPFTGAGGFYFAVLNGSTSLTVPKTDLGTFNPVLEFGIGLNLGLGKTFNKGILSAGLTLVFYGIVEGKLGWFKPYSPDKVRPSDPDLYYKLKGTCGIVGHIFGSVNFAIISATLDIIVYAQATVTIEAAEPILLAFEAGVSIQLTVKINLGIFSIKIHLSFSATIREQFTIGSSGPAQWKPLKANNYLYGLNLQKTAPIPLNWDSLVTIDTPQQLDIYFIPFFSASKPEQVQTTVGIASLFAENDNNAHLTNYVIDENSLRADSTLKTFDKLCIGILSWALHAATTEQQNTSFSDLLSDKIATLQIDQIINTLNQTIPTSSNTGSFNYKQLINFIKELYVLNLIKAQENQGETLPLTVFPMIPELLITDSANNVAVNFNTFNTVNELYLDEVIKLVSQFTDNDPENMKSVQSEQLESMATLLFTDYFQLLVKSLLQSAQENLEVYNYILPSNAENTLEAIAKEFNVTAQSLVLANKAVQGILLPGKNIVIPGIAYTLSAAETIASLQKLYPYINTGIDWNTEFIANNLKTMMFKAGASIEITGHEYIILADDTFDSIKNSHNLTLSELAEVVENNKTTLILETFRLVTLPHFTGTIDKDSTFLSFATTYSLELDIIAEANLDANILQNGASFFITNVQSLTVQTILNAVYQSNGFSKAGGSASRFALHGLRLPEVIAGNPGSALNGLYELTGQQFTMPLIDDPAQFSYTLTLSKPADSGIALNWIIFNGQSTDVNSIQYSLLKQEIDRIYAFQTIGISPKITKGPSPIQLYKDQSRVFAFSNPIAWSAFGRSPIPSIWNFPSSLSGIGSSDPLVDLKFAMQTRPDAAREVNALTPDSYFYGTMVPITIKKVSQQAKEKINERTFEVFGTDASGIETLTTLLRTDHIDTLLDSVSILYASNPDNDEARALRSDDLSKLLLLLINTNLSTETNPDTLRFAARSENNKISNTTPIDFITRVWKSSLVRTGGYYLYYDLDGETLPESLFDKNGNGEIYLLIQYKNLPKNQVTAYMNMAGLYQTIDTSQSLLFGEWKADLTAATPAELNQMLIKNQIIRNAVIKPGNIGFELNRENPDDLFNIEKVDSANYAYDLQIQYNLLNYAIHGDGKHFKSLQSVTPVSPATDTNTSNNDWRYSKAMPVRKFYNGQALSAYTGLGESVSIAFNWQDNYGNIFGTALEPVNYKILYFDQLIPFSTWPSLTTDYYFFRAVPKDSDANFKLTFHFTPGAKYSFNPTDPDVQNLKAAVVAQAKESLKIYAGILDQVIQNDVSINLKISTNPAELYPLDPAQQELKNGVIIFINTTTDWIQTFISNPDLHNQYQAPGNLNPNIYSYDYVFSSCINPVNQQDIFALAVNLLISRSTDLIDPQFIYNDNGKAVYAPGVQQVINSVKPKASDFTSRDRTDTDDKSLALRDFALNFEEAFSNQQFKLAATYVGEKNNTLTNTHNEELWVVRVKNNNDKTAGIACSVNYAEANYYAPQPLANFLFSLQDIEIHNFDFYTGGQTGISTRNFSGIDSEVWAQNFLQSIETILGSDLSLPITMIDHLNGSTDTQGILAKILNAKKIVADAIGLQTIPILLDPDQQEIALTLASEKIKQQLLINLYNGYMINTIVQYRVDMDTPYPNQIQHIAPNYYGKPFVNNQVADDAKNYSFSTAKIPLKNFATDQEYSESYLTYTFEAKMPSLLSHISVPVQYNITHAEFNIQKLKEQATNLPDDLDNYELSEWLNFIIPFDAAFSTIANTDIPVPLRQYPALPVFGSQIITSKVTNTEKETITIENAKLSNFSFDYTIDQFIAQDCYNFEVYFNADPEKITNLKDSKNLSAKQKALFAQLAQFETVSNDFTDYFKTNLPTVNKDTSSDELKTLTQILTSYSDLANDVANAWLNLYTKDLKASFTDMLEVITAVFELTESSSDSDPAKGLFQVAISNWSVVSADKAISYVYFPEVSILDWTSEWYYSTQLDGNDPLPIPEGQDPAQYKLVILRYYKINKGKKEYLSFTEGVTIRSRNITFKNLSVLLIQNAWAGLWIERNATLGQYPTAPEFIYSTPLNRFNNPIMPSLNLNNTFKLQPPAPDQKQLKQYICNLLSKLLLAPDQSTAAANLKILVQYKFTTSGQLGEMPYITLPILLVPPTLFTKADVEGNGEAVNALNQTILKWFADRQPLLNCGVITFSAFFYSNLTGTTNSLPLLVLNNLEIDVINISDIKQY